MRHDDFLEGAEAPGTRVRPFLSIGLPIYNCATTLDGAIRSILNQTFRNWELLLIEDGSTDETADLARRYADPRIRIFADGKHLGLVARLNQAISLSQGTYFARMDGDDVSYPERMALQVGYLEKHPEIDLLGAGILVFGRDGKALGTREIHITHEEICRRPWAGFYLPHPTWVGRIEWFRKHLYRCQAVRCEDQDLLLRTYDGSHFAALPEIVLGYREERLSLGKLLRGRSSFVRSAFREGSLRRKYWMGVGALLEQMLKGLTDCVAIGTGLEYRILRHRALPIDGVAQRRWNEIWRENGEGCVFI
jgi:glycosyltransferase involved in cell wall biosynthesis